VQLKIVQKLLPNVERLEGVYFILTGKLSESGGWFMCGLLARR